MALIEDYLLFWQEYKSYKFHSPLTPEEQHPWVITVGSFIIWIWVCNQSIRPGPAHEQAMLTPAVQVIFLYPLSSFSN